jgi:hypothetical protein
MVSNVNSDPSPLRGCAQRATGTPWAGAHGHMPAPLRGGYEPNGRPSPLHPRPPDRAPSPDCANRRRGRRPAREPSINGNRNPRFTSHLRVDLRDRLYWNVGGPFCGTWESHFSCKINSEIQKVQPF